MARTAKHGDAVYERLKRAILDWDLSPGTPLSEVRLAEQLGASRTPVREAIQRLAREGLARAVPGRGAHVAEISIQDTIHLFQMREALEVQAARLACAKARKEDVQSLLDRFVGEAHSIIDAGDYSGYLSLTASMDQFLVGAAGNPRLTAALEEIWAQTWRIRRLSSTDDARLHASVAEHVAILTAVNSGDPMAAGRAVRAHVQKSLRNILDSAMAQFGSVDGQDI